MRNEAGDEEQRSPTSTHILSKLGSSGVNVPLRCGGLQLHGQQPLGGEIAQLLQFAFVDIQFD